jgi:hypothetical protein
MVYIKRMVAETFCAMSPTIYQRCRFAQLALHGSLPKSLCPLQCCAHLPPDIARLSTSLSPKLITSFEMASFDVADCLNMSAFPNQPSSRKQVSDTNSFCVGEHLTTLQAFQSLHSNGFLRICSGIKQEIVAAFPVPTSTKESGNAISLTCLRIQC